MAEVDYGYGEDLDYGYGEPDMVAEEDASPQSTMIDDTDLGANTSIEDSTAAIANAVRRGPKRRCSVTKFSLESDNATTPTILTAASVIDAMRNGTHDATIPSATNTSGADDERRVITPHNSSDFCYGDQVEAAFDEIDIADDDVEPAAEAATKGKKNGVLRILSLRRK